MRETRYLRKVGLNSLFSRHSESKPGGALFVGFATRSQFQYHDEVVKDGAYCLCECCAFKQWASFSNVTGSGLQSSRASSSQHWEDCTITRSTGERAWVPDEAGKSGKYPETKPGDRVDCLGTPGGTGFEKGPWTCEVWEDKANELACEYRIRDYPGVEFPPGAGGTRFSMDFDFIGRIFDVCKNNAIRWTGRYKVSGSGMATSDRVDWDGPPEATTGVGPDGKGGTKMPVGGQTPRKEGVC